MRVAGGIRNKLSITMSDSTAGGTEEYYSYSTPSLPMFVIFVTHLQNTALYDTTYKYVLAVQCVVIQMCANNIGRCNVL